ncbi:hypothetical protein M514_02787 [Trichuris suis]|uniref:Uncharacterized protein n=1 Tax=Trichuris suis TaxID=68888 RepID=A0A085N2U5_9BILA|nr:hypothetical protein M513_02787 [Trichuris suis]KFD63791.1 hypothetical protein M514_02787 [Trichuris suis]
MVRSLKVGTPNGRNTENRNSDGGNTERSKYRKSRCRLFKMLKVKIPNGGNVEQSKYRRTKFRMPEILNRVGPRYPRSSYSRIPYSTVSPKDNP